MRFPRMPSQAAWPRAKSAASSGPWSSPQTAYFTHLEYYGGRSVRAHARWFARSFPFARLAVVALGAVHPRSRWDLLVLDASFVPKSGRGTWGTDWFGSGMARAVRWGLEVTLLAAVDLDAGNRNAYPSAPVGRPVLTSVPWPIRYPLWCNGSWRNCRAHPVAI